MKHSVSVCVRGALAVGAMLVFTGSTAFAQSAVAWTGVVRASASGATLKNTSGCGDCYDAGAVSQQQITSGSVSFHVAPGQKLFAGLGRDLSTSTSYTTINYAFKFTGGSSWEIRESNVYRTEGTYASTDVFKITVSGSS